MNNVLPASTDTGMKQEFQDMVGSEEGLIAQAGLAGRLATSEEMAGPMVFLNSDMASFVSGVTRVLLVLIFIRGWIIGDHSQDFLIIITFILTYFPSILSKKFGVYLPKRLQLIITLFIFSAQILGEIGDFYEKIPWWDTMLHTISGVVLGLVGFLFVYLLNEKGNINVNLSPRFVIVFAFCFALTMGVFWEFFEFGADRLLGYNMQKFRMPGQDGLVDTMGDLIVDAVGAIVACIGGYR